MFLVKVIALIALVASVHSRYVLLQDEYDPNLIGIVAVDPEEYILEQDMESVHPRILRNARVRRQTAGAISTNPDGTFNINTKTRLAGDDKNSLNALTGVNALKPGGKFGVATGGLGFENHNGHAATLTGSNIPGFGNQLTAAGKVGLVHTDTHKLNANAFITNNRPTIPNIPNFNTHGGSLDYLYKDKIGGSLGVAKTPFLQRTDYSAMGNLNLLRSPTSSLDFNAGLSKSVAPYIPSSRWQPSGGLSFTRFF